MVLSLLYAQWALASYACPGQAHAEAMAAMMAAGQPCDAMDPAQPALCHQHATGTTPSVEASQMPVTPLPALVQVLALPLVVEAGTVLAQPIPARSDARPPPDPLFQSTLRIRV